MFVVLRVMIGKKACLKNIEPIHDSSEILAVFWAGVDIYPNHNYFSFFPIDQKVGDLVGQFLGQRKESIWILLFLAKLFRI